MMEETMQKKMFIYNVTDIYSQTYKIIHIYIYTNVILE